MRVRARSLSVTAVMVLCVQLAAAAPTPPVPVSEPAVVPLQEQSGSVCYSLDGSALPCQVRKLRRRSAPLPALNSRWVTPPL
ncbi:hypothetical protein C8J57DRAFT_339026 [Mycena rebaudengoi]|nr:hypothetical protein C8J57DRAFT_339026 [Mycena rebaudengoi]